ncbi:hypothetical protein ROZALSC1DRAFT_19594 [Rozella allomycis CSF55]|uniref:diacylglycerol O-acyltransferase n=1 Tax=Rozella allomycis (strain CSF55) TaxID=988480 RepID=A0A4P9YGA6_ROZAC|nr:hypothetical protein ROZALSC1DRAFT_19594 [Rozella allomycis CSF55]
MGYPDNINVKNFIDFICLEYPRTDRVRKGYVLRRVVELISSLLMIHFLLEQYATPTVQNSLKPMVEKNVPMIIERLLKLSLSSLYIWLLMFYSFFHCYLGIFAELTRFGDREFYLDWWNARDVGTYWRQWNIPVHSWLKRHMYLPLRRRGISGIMCQIVVFLVSSLLHEIAVGIPTHVIQGWAFMGMIIQIPLIMITDMIQRIRPESHLGNYIFWMSFVILGQPMCVLLYYRGWYVKNELIN